MENRFEVFILLINKINKGIKKIKTIEMEEFGLKSVHVNCLCYLYKNESLTAVKLCELTDKDKAGISRSLDFLEKKGLVICESENKKRYNSPLKLTAIGKDVAKQTIAKIDNYLESIGEGITSENRDILYYCLTQISNNIDKVCGVK